MKATVTHSGLIQCQAILSAAQRHYQHLAGRLNPIFVLHASRSMTGYRPHHGFCPGSAISPYTSRPGQGKAKVAALVEICRSLSSPFLTTSCLHSTTLTRSGAKASHSGPESIVSNAKQESLPHQRASAHTGLPKPTFSATMEVTQAVRRQHHGKTAQLPHVLRLRHRKPHRPAPCHSTPTMKAAASPASGPARSIRAILDNLHGGIISTLLDVPTQISVHARVLAV